MKTTMKKGVPPFAALAALVLLGMTTAARAQTAHVPQFPGVCADTQAPYLCGSVFTTSQGESIVFNTPTVTKTTLDTYATTVQGRLVGGSLLYNQTFDQPFGSATVNGGVTAARLAITTAGGPGVVIAAPRLISHSVTSSTTVTGATYSLNHAETSEALIQYVGNVDANGDATMDAYTETADDGLVINTVYAPLITGIQSTCDVSNLPSTARPTCHDVTPQPLSGATECVFFHPNELPPCLAGTTISLIPVSGAIVVVDQVNTTDYVDEADTATTTNLTSETYLIEGTVKPLGTLHVMAPVAIFEDGEGFLDRLSAMGSGSGPWLEAWTGQSKTKADGDLPGGARDSHGLNGGLQGEKNGFRLGIAVSSGAADLKIRGAGEYGRADLTDVALYAGWQGGPWFVSAAAGHGHGRIASTVSPIGTNESAFADRGFDSAFAGIQGGVNLPLGRATVTPELGASHVRARMDALQEQGSDFALRGNGNTYHRDAAYAGVSVSLPVTPTLSLQVTARALDRSGVLSPALAVGFAGAPDAELTLTGPRDKAGALEAGVSATWTIGAHAQAYAGYDTVSSGRVTGTTARLGLRITF